MPLSVKDVMTPGVAAVRPEASLVEAARLMRTQDIGEVLVAVGDHVVGVLTDRDITVRAVAEGDDPLGVTVDSVCTPSPVTVSPDDTVARVVALMRQHAVRRLPVIDGERPVGVVSLGDLAEFHDAESALGAISSADPNSLSGPRGL